MGFCGKLKKPKVPYTLKCKSHNTLKVNQVLSFVNNEEDILIAHFKNSNKYNDIHHFLTNVFSNKVDESNGEKHPICMQMFESHGF